MQTTKRTTCIDKNWDIYDWCVTCLFVVEDRSLLSTKHVALRSSYKIKEQHNINTHSKQQNQASQTIQFASLVIQRILCLLNLWFYDFGKDGMRLGLQGFGFKTFKCRFNKGSHILERNRSSMSYWKDLICYKRHRYNG